MLRAASLLLLAGCNQLFGIHDTALLDEPLEPLLVPTPGAPCPTALPAFGTWTYARKPFPNYTITDNSLQHAAFYGTSRAYVGDGFSIYDTGVDGDLDPTPLLSFSDMTSIVSFGTDPRGEVLWYEHGGLLVSPGVYNSAAYYAIRARQWEIHDAILPFPDATFAVDPSSVAFYAGTIRMTVTVMDTSSSVLRMVELTSQRGYHWTDTHTLDRFAMGDGTPYLSPDGCVLLFTHNDATQKPRLYAALRDDATGDFGAEVHLAGAPDQDVYSMNPALDASQKHLWYFHSFVETPCCDHSMIEGLSP